MITKKLLLVLVLIMLITPLIVGAISLATSQPAAARDACDTAADYGNSSTQWNFLCFIERMFEYIFSGGGDW